MTSSLDSRAKDLVRIGDGLHSKRASLLTLWQDVAENFYPERADFTTTRYTGQEFASHLMSSYPVQARRDLGNMFASMLRPRSTNKPWFEIHVQDDEVDERDDARAWLEWATGVQRRAMYDPVACMTKATNQADHDFVTFGQAILELRTNSALDALLYRTWHLRDGAWLENEGGRVDCMHLNWAPTVRQLVKMFPGKLHREVAKCADKEPDREIKCRRVVVPRDEYGYRDGRAPRAGYYSLYIDLENQHVMEEGPISRFPYIVPRWQTIAGCQYARSPATEIVLPDARSLQTFTRVLMEAGEKAADPPMIAVQEALRSDFATYAGGVTWADAEYDERLGDVLRPLNADYRGLPFGENMAKDMREAIASGFYINKITLPPDIGDMTAYETRKRIEEHVRSAAPLFEPVEEEYTARLCEGTFEELMANGAFGSIEDMPEVLRDKTLRFNFTSPLREAEDEMKARRFVEGAEILKTAAEIDPAQIQNVNITKVTREALRGLGFPADWLNPEEAVDVAREQAAQAAQTQAIAQQADAAVEIAGKVGPAVDGLAKAGVR